MRGQGDRCGAGWRGRSAALRLLEERGGSLENLGNRRRLTPVHGRSTVKHGKPSIVRGLPVCANLHSPSARMCVGVRSSAMQKSVAVHRAWPCVGARAWRTREARCASRMTWVRASDLYKSRLSIDYQILLEISAIIVAVSCKRYIAKLAKRFDFVSSRKRRW